MASLPVSKDAHSLVAKMGTMTKGFLPTCSLSDFPPEPEKASQTLSGFLHLWYKEGLKKPEAKKALSIANPKLTVLEKDTILSRLQLYRQFFQRKKKNLKNGEKTDPCVLHILKAFESEDGAKLEKSKGKPEQGTQPTKRIRRKTPEKDIARKPEEGSQLETKEGQPEVVLGSTSSPSGSKVPEQGKGLEKPAKPVLMIVSCSPGSPSMASNAGSVMTVSDTSSGYVPAALMSSAWKRPAAKLGKATKKPAKKTVSGITKHSWVASCSFGWVKVTQASQKAYIQAKSDMGSKPYCLVNVSLNKGPDQDSTMESLMKEVLKPGLSKAHIVDFKNNLLKRL